MKTQDQIVKRFEERREYDFLGFEVGEYVDFMDFEHAKPYIKDGVTKEQWLEVFKEPSRENILARMEEYMEFAWEKANNCRGISAGRSISHYVAWIWLLGDDEFLAKFEEIDYEHYGKEKLIAICENYSWDWKQYDNGVRTNTDY